MWDLSSPTKNRIHAPCSETAESTTGLPKKSPSSLLKCQCKYFAWGKKSSHRRPDKDLRSSWEGLLKDNWGKMYMNNVQLLGKRNRSWSKCLRLKKKKKMLKTQCKEGTLKAGSSSRGSPREVGHGEEGKDTCTAVKHKSICMGSQIQWTCTD